MEFDRKTIMAFVLIGIILIIANTPFYQKLVDPKGYELRQQRKVQMQNQQNDDVVVEDVPAPAIENNVTSLHNLAQESNTVTTAVETIDEPLVQVEQDEKLVTVENNVATFTFTTRGGNIAQALLHDYDAPEGKVVLFPEHSFKTTDLSFTTFTNDSIVTSQYNFTTDNSESLSAKATEQKVSFTLRFSENQFIRKTFVIRPDGYDVVLNVELVNMDNIITDKKYIISAPHGITTSENNMKEDMQYAKVGVFSGGDLENGFKPNGKQIKQSGDIDWVAVRNKYFSLFIAPQNTKISDVQILGNQIQLNKDDNAKWKEFVVDATIPYLGEKNKVDSFLLYMGPLEFNTLKSYERNFQDFKDFGFIIIKPFSIGILKLFKWMHGYIANYGVILLIFAFMVKIVVYPLTHKSYESMQKMQAVQPKLKDLQEKYKSDPQKLNEQTMKLYKEEGVNPAGGCLPMLLQMPLLIGLFIVFRTTIDLRGAEFIWWITDLSGPDTIYTLPFSLPLYGDKVNILPLFMAVTMLIQQKLTVTDPKQKMMVYFMPLFMFILFNNFPSGLNLYYALFNLLSIIQQKYLVPRHMEKMAAKQS